MYGDTDQKEQSAIFGAQPQWISKSELKMLLLFMLAELWNRKVFWNYDTPFFLRFSQETTRQSEKRKPSESYQWH